MKKNRHLILQVFLISILLASCQKFGHGNVNGHVVELGTNEPIENAKLEIQEERYMPGGGITSSHRSYKTVASTVTDSKGEFQLFFRKHLGRSYQLNLVSTPQHMRDEAFFRLPEKNIQHDFLVNPFAYVKLRIKKTSMANRKRINIYSLAWHLISYNVEVQNQLDTILPEVYDVAALKEMELYWMVTENLNPSNTYTEKMTPHQDKIFLKKGDTLLKTIVVD